MAAAANRQRQIALARRADRGLDIFGGPAMDHRAWPAADRLCPNPGCSGIAVVAWHRYLAGQLPAETVEFAFDQVGHGTLSGSVARPARPVTTDLPRSERLFVKIPAL
jgi:hypothetical protein